jgi:hypothetical protein
MHTILLRNSRAREYGRFERRWPVRATAASGRREPFVTPKFSFLKIQIRSNFGEWLLSGLEASNGGWGPTGEGTRNEIAAKHLKTLETAKSGSLRA